MSPTRLTDELDKIGATIHPRVLRKPFSLLLAVRFSSLLLECDNFNGAFCIGGAERFAYPPLLVDGFHSFVFAYDLRMPSSACRVLKPLAVSLHFGHMHRLCLWLMVASVCCIYVLAMFYANI